MDNRHFGGPRPLPGCRPSFGDLEFSAAEINELLKQLVKMQDVEGLVSGVNIVNIENHELLQPGNLTLEDLGAARLANMNDVFVPWQGSAYDTRNYLPALLRRKGISISYVTDKGIAVKERAVSDVGIDNANWGIDSNWMRVDELSLNGELRVSPNGTWVINGVDSGIQALGPKGDNGLTPRLKTIDNKLHYSYDGKTWLDSEGEYISAWFRWSGNKIQISRDNKTWEDFSGEFADNLFIKGYVDTFDKLPADAVQGDIWGVGPTNADTNPTYRYYVRNAGGWVDNGQFTSIAAGIVQETGDGEGVVMSQKAVSEKLAELVDVSGNLQAPYIAQDLIIDKKQYRVSDRRFNELEQKIFKEIKYADNETIIGDTSHTWSLAKEFLIPAKGISEIDISIATATAELEANVQIQILDVIGNVVATISNEDHFTSDYRKIIFTSAFSSLAVTYRILIWATNGNIVPTMEYTGVTIVAKTNSSIEKSIEILKSETDAKFTKIFKEIKYADNETIIGDTSHTWSLAKEFLIPAKGVSEIDISIATATAELMANVQICALDAQGNQIITIANNEHFTSNYSNVIYPLLYSGAVTIAIYIWATNGNIVPTMEYTGVTIVAKTYSSIEERVEIIERNYTQSGGIINQFGQKTFSITSAWQIAEDITIDSSEYSLVRIKLNSASMRPEANLQVFAIVNGVLTEIAGRGIDKNTVLPYNETFDISSYDSFRIVLWASNQESSGTITYTGFEVSVLSDVILQDNFKKSAERGIMPKCILPDNKDIYVTLFGSSIFQYFNSKDKADDGVAEVPMSCEKQAAAYYLWKNIVFGNPQYRRFDFGKYSLVGDYCDKWLDDSNAFFNESGTWKSVYNSDLPQDSIVVTTKIEGTAPIYDGYQVPDLDSTLMTIGSGTTSLRQEPVRMSNGNGASVSFKIPAGYSKCDFIYLASILGDSVTITTNRNDGIVKYSDRHDYSSASEANNATFSTEFTPVTIGSRTIKGMPNEKISFYIEDTSIDTTITITKSSDTGKYLFYWGVVFWGTEKEPYAVLFSNLSRGSFTAYDFYNRRTLFEETTHPDVVLLQFTLVNSFGSDFGINRINNFISTYNSMKSAFAQDGVDVAYIGTYIAPSQYSNASPISGINYLLKSISKWLQDNELEYFGSADFILRKTWDIYYSKENTYKDWLAMLTDDNTHFNTLGYKVWRELFGNLE